MKVLQINTVYGEGSTGKIVKGLHDLCNGHQIDCLCAHRFVKKGSVPLEDSIVISSKWDSRIHGGLSRFTMFKGMGSVLKTVWFLKRVKQYAPDVIHLHNLHGSYVNLPMLFHYIKAHHIPVVWTLHDCWAFTAICSHFTIEQCDKWKTGCHHCTQKKRFSSSLFDFSKAVWKRKKAWFQGLSNAIVVTPSEWLADLARQSFLREYPIVTIHNGIDLHTFAPIASDFRQKHGLENKKIVLGVAFGWGYEKGLDVFIALSERLGEDYQVVLVGTDEEIDRVLPNTILSIHRTHDQQELAKIYAAADVLVNPTREDTFPTVNLEALACGTPVLTFRTGGSPECIDENCGAVVEQDDLETIEKEIVRICMKKPYVADACVKRAAQFDKNQRLEEYIRIYKSLE